MELKDKIKMHRQQLGLTLEELAVKVGVSKVAIHKWESGYIKSLKLDKIQKLADALNTTPAYLMDWEDCPDYSLHKEIEFTPDEKQLIFDMRGKGVTTEVINRFLQLIQNQD